MLLLCLLTFLTGAIFEAACVGWVHFSEKGKSLQSALFAVIIASSNIFGLGESIKDWRIAPFFILGYAFGTFMAVEIKSFYAKRKDETTCM